MVTTMKNFKLVRGDSLTFGFQVRGLDEPIDEVHFSCKQNISDSVCIFQRSLGDGITFDGESTYSVRIAPENTASLQARKYWYDLEIIIGSDVYTLLLGQIDLYADVTRR